MAKASMDFVLYLALFLLLAIFCTPAISHIIAHPKHVHLRYFLHDSLNFTDFIVIQPPGTNTPTASPFGTMFCYNDAVTQAPEPTSKLVGRFIGTSIAASFDGLTFFSSSTLVFNTTEHEGSLSVMGAVDTLVSSGIPVVGGTKDFLYAVGSIVLSPVNVSTFNITYSMDIDLSWPPYAHV